MTNKLVRLVHDHNKNITELDDVAGAKVWNNLPGDVTSALSLYLLLGTG